MGRRRARKEARTLTDRDPKREERRAKDYALYLLSFRMRSEAEIENRLSRKGFDPDVIAKAVDDLRRVGLLDDREFSRLWIRNRMTINPVGRRNLRLELRRKGVSDNVVGEILAEIENDYDETALAMRVARKRVGRYSRLDRGAMKRRLAGVLARRGFEYSTIDAVIRQLLGSGEAGESREPEESGETGAPGKSDQGVESGEAVEPSGGREPDVAGGIVS
jgi:regulatory protein